MNAWECDFPGCTSAAVGTGGAIGLAAIGWWFRPGGISGGAGLNIRCPSHRPDPIPCTNSSIERDECSNCRADQVAEEIQNAILHHYDSILAWDAERRLAGRSV